MEMSKYYFESNNFIFTLRNNTALALNCCFKLIIHWFEFSRYSDVTGCICVPSKRKPGLLKKQFTVKDDLFRF